jgi:hypothetical protein
MAAEPSPILKRTLVWVNYHTCVKNQGENLYGSGTITYKQLSLNHVCKIGLMNQILEKLLLANIKGTFEIRKI